MRPSPRLVLLALAPLLLAAPAAAGLTREEAEAAAVAAGRALTSSRADALKPLLPTRGKVHLTLERLGPEDGMFAAGQVVAVFRDFLAEGGVGSFLVQRLEGDERARMQAWTRATITDREGRKAEIGLRLGFEPEDGRWVLREVKESGE